MLYDITLKSGRVITVEANSPEEARAAAERFLDEEEQAAQLSFPEQFGRQLGLTGRYIAEGLAQIPDIVAPLATIPYELATGQPIGSTPTLRERTGRALTQAGVPQPVGAVEQLVGEASRALVPVGAGVAAGRAVAAAPGVVGQVGRFMAAEPGLQATATTAATTAASAAREMGGTAVEQTAAGLAAGVAPYVLRPGAAPPPQEMIRDLATDTGVSIRVPMPRQAAPAQPAAAGPQELDPQAFGELVRRAATGGLGSQQAVEELAKLAKANPEALAAAERLGIDLPPDVWADHTQLKEAVGLTRSVAGSVASATWRDQVREAAEAADEALAQIDASPDLSAVSSRIRTTLTDQQAALGRQADELYRVIDERIAPSTRVDPTNLRRTLNQIIRDLGGGEPGQGIAGLTAQERRLYQMIMPGSKQPVTYARLMREKALIGKALENKDSPYSDIDQATLKRLYGALAEDQLDAAGAIGGPQLRADLRLANQTTAKKKALEKRITTIFGNDLEGSIAPQLRGAIMAGARGDTSQLSRALRAIPPDLRKQAVGTAIAALSRGGPEGGFGFARYAAIYRSLRQNSESYKLIANTVGPDGERFLRDLYEVSRRVTEARANVITTGKANQALVQGLTGEGLVAQALNSTVGRRTMQGAASVAAGATGGPIAGAATAMLLEKAVSGTRKEALNAAGEMFSSPEFNELVINISTKSRASERAIKAVENSKAFRNWVQVVGLREPETWLRGAIATSYAQNARQPLEIDITEGIAP